MQRHGTKQSRSANKAEKDFIVWTKNRNCAYCGSPGPSRYDHCAGSSAKIKVDYVTVLIGHYFGLAECMSCAEMTHKQKREAFGSHHKLWLREVTDYPEDIPDEVIRGIVEYGRKYGR